MDADSLACPSFVLPEPALSVERALNAMTVSPRINADGR